MNDWLVSNSDRIVGLMGTHLALALVPVLLAVLISVPLGLALSGRVSAGPLMQPKALGYVLPALALLVFLRAVVDDPRLDNAVVVVALTVPATFLMTRRVVAGVRDVPADVRRGALGMGYGRLRRHLRVELPLAAPSIFAGLRVATVASISLVTLAALVGGDGLGTLFLESLRDDVHVPALTGVALTLVAAGLADAFVRGAEWLAVPWNRGAEA